MEKRSIELGFGSGQYGALIGCGIAGMLPTTTWLATLSIGLLGQGPPKTGSQGLDGVISFTLVVVMLFAMLVAPSLVPCLVLRARQPKGARIDWDDESVVEWDGEWKRTIIPWKDAEGSLHRWEEKSRSGTISYEAVQIVDVKTNATITAWTAPPSGMAVVRRRLCSDDVVLLRDAMKDKLAMLTRPFEAGRVVDPRRPPWRLPRIVGRFGYPLAVAGPIMVASSPAVGWALGIGATILLAVRALPPLAELRALRANTTASGTAAEEGEGPYRAAGTRSEEQDAPSPEREAVERARFRATAIEALVRVVLVPLSIMTLIVSALPPKP